MAGGTNEREEDLISGINVTPLVDVVLVLLIILMVTAQYVHEKDKESIPVELPKGATGETDIPSTLAVSIDKDGKFYLDAEAMNLDVMRARIRKAFVANNDTRAVIAADGRVSHSKVVTVIDLLRQEKITKFAINVRPEDLPKQTQ